MQNPGITLKEEKNRTRQNKEVTKQIQTEEKKIKMCALSEGSQVKTNRHFFQSGSQSI